MHKCVILLQFLIKCIFKKKKRKAETDHMLYKKAKKTFNKRCGKKKNK